MVLAAGFCGTVNPRYACDSDDNLAFKPLFGREGAMGSG